MLVHFGLFLYTLLVVLALATSLPDSKYSDSGAYSKVSHRIYGDEQYSSKEALSPEYLASLPRPKPIEESTEIYKESHPALSDARPQYLVPNIQNDRQVQKAASYLAGPQFVQEVQIAQQAAQAAQAQAAAQRRAQTQAIRQGQQLRAAQQPQFVQPQYPQEQYIQPQYSATNVDPQYVREPSQSIQQRPQEEEEDYDPDPSYQFGFYVKDDVNTNYQNRKEQRNGNTISGSYSVVDADGFLRTVKYTAHPKEGFKAEVERKPTDIVVKVPAPYNRQKLAQEVPNEQELQTPRPKYVYQYQ